MKKIIAFLLFFLFTPLLLQAAEVTQTEVKKVVGEVKWRKGIGLWKTLSLGRKLGAESEIQTGSSGNLTLQFSEGSRVDLQPDTKIKLESLHDPSLQPLLWISLEKGGMHVRASAFESYRSFSIHTPFATAIVNEGKQSFLINQDTDRNLTTLAVEEGVVMLQPESSEIRPINLGAGEQISLNLSKMGPIVAFGTPPGLDEPIEISHKLLDLQYMQVCEIAEGDGQQEICGVWTWDRKTQAFNAAWQNGKASLLKIEKMSGGEILLTSKELPEAADGLTGRYTGRVTGGDLEGDTIIQLLSGTVTWQRQGKTSAGTWRARSHNYFELD